MPEIIVNNTTLRPCDAQDQAQGVMFLPVLSLFSLFPAFCLQTPVQVRTAGPTSCSQVIRIVIAIDYTCFVRTRRWTTTIMIDNW